MWHSEGERLSAEDLPGHFPLTFSEHNNIVLEILPQSCKRAHGWYTYNKELHKATTIYGSTVITMHLHVCGETSVGN